MIKPRKTIEDITPYETDKYYQNWAMKLDSNENIYGVNNKVVETIKNFDLKKVSLYPSYGNLLDKLSKRYSVSTDELLLTNGCDEALNIVINTYLEAGEEILSYTPSFSMPLLYSKAAGAKIKTIDYDKKFVFDFNKFNSNISNNTKIAYIATPNNPTGEVTAPSDIEKLLQNNPETLFIIDCTYINFSYSFKFEDYVELKKYNNAVILKSFSKDFALAGLRLGFVAADKTVITNLKKIASPYNVNSVAAAAAITVLDNENDFIKVKEDNKKALEILTDSLKALGYNPFQSEANFVLCDFSSHCDFFYQKLKNFGIIVRKYAKNSNLETCLRITLPKLEYVQKLADLFKPRPMYVFDMDGVIFDVSQSYRAAIIKTFEHFAGYPCSTNEIQAVKNLGGMSNDWKVTEYLLNQKGINPGYDKVVEVFQSLFFIEENKTGEKGLIDFERPVLDKNFFEEVSKFADIALFTSRERIEAFYSMEKTDIKKYFSYFICIEDVGELSKPNPLGLNLIKKHCPNSAIYYFGDTIDDVKAGVDASINAFGIIPPNAVEIEKTVAALKAQGATEVFKNKEEILKAELYKNSKELMCK